MNIEQLDIITSLILLMLTMLPSLSDQLQADSVLQYLCCYTGLKLSWPKTKLQKWVQVTRCRKSSDGVPVDGLHLPLQ